MSRGPVAAYDTGLVWFKSSHSDSSNGSECVEVAAASDAVLVRDSKDVSGPCLGFARTTWADFVPYVTEG